MDLKFAVSIIGYDQLTGVLGRCADSMMDFGNRASEAGDSLYEAGESMVKFGENLSWTTFLIREGADKLHEWSDAVTEPAMSLQQELANLGARSHLSAEGLAAVKDAAVDFSNTHAGATAEAYVEQFQRFAGIMPDTKSAMDATGEALMLARETGIDAASATNLLSVAYSNMHQPLGTTGDMLTELQKQFSLSPEAMGQLSTMLGRLAGDAKLSGGSLSEMMAIAGEANKLMPNRGAQLFSSGIGEFIEHAAKSGIDTTHGLIAALEQAQNIVGGLAGPEKSEELKRLGLTNPAMVQLLDNLGAIKTANQALLGSTGALGTAYAIATNNATDATSLLHQSVSNLFDAMASPTLMTLAHEMEWLTSKAQGMAKFFEAHPTLSKYIVEPLEVAGATLTGVVGAISSLGVVAVLGGRGIQAIGTGMKLLDIESWTLRFMYWGEGIAGAASSTYEFGASLLAASWPLLAIGGTIAVVAVGAYEIYKHWDFFKPYWNGLWDWAKNGLTEFVDWIPKEIEAGISAAEGAASHLAHAIGSYFVGHSPPPAGPLHELAARPLSKTIADTLAPDSHMASRASGMAGAVAGGIGAGGGATINYSAIFNFGGAVGTDQRQAFLDLLRQSAYELKRIIDGESITRGRTALA